MVRLAVGATLVVLLAVAGWGLTLPAGAAYDPSDEWQGLPPGEGRQTVYVNCIACHSTAIIQQQRLSGTVWRRTLATMVDEMGMPKLTDDEQALVLDYLIEHFGQEVPR